MAEKPLEPSYFVFRNLFVFLSDREYLCSGPERTLKGWYVRLCQALGVKPNYRENLMREAALQAKVSSNGEIRYHQKELRTLFETPLGVSPFLRHPKPRSLPARILRKLRTFS